MLIKVGESSREKMKKQKSSFREKSGSGFRNSTCKFTKGEVREGSKSYSKLHSATVLGVHP